MEEIRTYSIEFDIRDIRSMTQLSDEECAQEQVQKFVNTCYKGAYIIEVVDILNYSMRKYSNASVGRVGNICVIVRYRVEVYVSGLMLAGVRVPKRGVTSKFRISTLRYNLIMEDEDLLSSFPSNARIPVEIGEVSMEQGCHKINAYVKLARPLEGVLETYVLDGIEPDRLDHLVEMSSKLSKPKKFKYARVFDSKTKYKGSTYFLGDGEFFKKFKGGVVQFTLGSGGEFSVISKEPDDQPILSGSAFAAFAGMIAQYTQYTRFLSDMELKENDCSTLFDIF